MTMTRPWGNSALMPCGTDAAYSRHLRHGDPVDVPCSAAHARESAERRRLRTGQSERVSAARQRVAAEAAARQLIERHAREYAVLVTAAMLQMSEAS